MYRIVLENKELGLRVEEILRDNSYESDIEVSLSDKDKEIINNIHKINMDEVRYTN